MRQNLFATIAPGSTEARSAPLRRLGSGPYRGLRPLQRARVAGTRTIPSATTGSVVGAVAALLALAPVGCSSHATLEELGAENDCRRTVIVGAPAAAIEGEAATAADTLEGATSAPGEAKREAWTVEWRLPGEPADVGRLNAWCAAVGPAIAGGWGERSGTPSADTVWLVSWNVHVGGGDLTRLLEDLRDGVLTDGRPVEHFVVLLQESYRAGDRVPEWDPGLPGGSGIDAAPPGSPREDVVAVAKRFGLFLLYVPSMRNGESEDRGNAILSTLPLRDPVAIGLPVARQRRVAIAATVSGRAADGRDWRLQVASVHLESSPRGWRSDEAQRLEQAEALVDLLPDAEAAIAAGDFNTKTRGRQEALVQVMLRAYPDTPPFPPGPTYQKVRGIYREYLDYIFYRLPPATAGRYERVARIYHSDHYPLIGWVAW